MQLFNEFIEENPTYNDIKDISLFHKIIKFTKIASLKEESIKNVIADLIVKMLVQQLKSSSLFAFDSISVSTEDDITITFGDDIFHFAIIVDDDSFIFLKKEATIKNFLDTCEIFMPFFNSIYNDVASYIQGVTQNIVFVPYFCGYKFDFKIEDFRPATKSVKKTIPNYELMERLVPSIEKAESPVSKVGYEWRGRTDLTLSGMLSLDEINWLGWIVIEAPGNQNYSTMKLSFELQSLTIEDPRQNGKRLPFNPQSIDTWKTPFLAFLKDKIFRGFLQDWLGDVRVKSIRR